MAARGRSSSSRVLEPPVKRSPALDYAEKVLSGDIIAGPWVRKACERHLRDLARQGTKGFPYVFDEAMEARFATFTRFVNLAEDTPFTLLPYQEFIFGALYGWVDANRHRRFRTAFIEMGKGNGKSPMAGLVGLFGLLADGEAKAEIYAAAVTRDQANILFRDAKQMAEASPHLAGRLTILTHNISVGDAFFRPVSREAGNLSGWRPHNALIDEIHEHPTGEVVQKLRAGQKGRMQPLIFEITNSGSDRTSICFEHHQHSLAVVEETIEDERWFSYVCALDDGDDWHDAAVWEKTNPGLDALNLRSYLHEQVREADAMPSAENLVKRLNFCIWTEQAERWLDLESWDACNAEPVPPALLRGKRCYVGLDLASRYDFTAAAFWFPDSKAALLRFWVPEQMEHRSAAQRETIMRWAGMGLVKLTPGNITDYDQVREDLLREARSYQVEEIAYDQWNATQLATQIQNTGATVVPMQQGGSAMSEAGKELEALVQALALRHGGNPVLRWMASNVATREDQQGNIKLDRDRSGDKIDGIVALVMAIARSMVGRGQRGWIVR